MNRFQVFERPALGSGGRSRGQRPSISVGKPGLLSLNRSATELFAPADSWYFVRLLSDGDTREIALEATDEKDPNGWKARPRSSGGVVINAKAFILHLGVAPGTRWAVHRDGDLLVGRLEREAGA